MEMNKLTRSVHTLMLDLIATIEHKLPQSLTFLLQVFNRVRRVSEWEQQSVDVETELPSAM